MINRRAFLRKSVQLSIMAGLVAGTAYIVVRNGVDINCSDNQLCRECSKLKACSLEKAINFKKDDREKTS